jgi:plastocyanin
LNQARRVNAGRRTRLPEILFAAALVASVPFGLLAVTVSGRVTVKGGSKKAKSSPAVVWLTPLSDAPVPVRTPDTQHPPYQLVQKDKEFHPHLLIVPVGSVVEFPNRDPFFHNVFSLFDGKRFDLGLYEAGSTRSIRFSRPGISYIFCNIHPEMSAVIIALNTPYYGVSDGAGKITIPDVPPGRYKLEVWREGALPAELKKLEREITVSQDSSSLGTFHFNETVTGVLAHKNLYGRDYDQPASSSPLYDHPK